MRKKCEKNHLFSLFSPRELKVIHILFPPLMPVCLFFPTHAWKWTLCSSPPSRSCMHKRDCICVYALTHTHAGRNNRLGLILCVKGNMERRDSCRKVNKSGMNSHLTVSITVSHFILNSPRTIMSPCLTSPKVCGGVLRPIGKPEEILRPDGKLRHQTHFSQNRHNHGVVWRNLVNDTCMMM